MKFCNVAVPKIRFIMNGSCKYSQNKCMEYFRYLSPVLIGSISIFILLKDDFGIDVYLQEFIVLYISSLTFRMKTTIYRELF